MNNEQRLIILAHNKGYKVDINGNVISPFSGKKLKLKERTDGYLAFSIKDPRSKGTRAVYCHRLVSYSKFKDKSFEKGIHTRHLDGNSFNNSPENIDIGTISENQMDKPSKVRKEMAINASTKIRRFSDKVVEEIKTDRDNGFTYKELSEKYNASTGSLHFMVNNKYVTTK